MIRPTASALSTAGEKHLGSYALAAAAGIGALTSAQVAQASIQSFSYAPQTIGQNDYSGYQTFQLFTNGPTLTLRNVSANSSVPVGALNSHGLALLGGTYATNLAAGAAISANRTFTTVTANSKFGGDRQIGYYNSFYHKANNGQFINTTGYLGFKFTDPTNSAQTDYGWVRIGENYNQTVLTIYSAAYDNTGAKITAGQTVAAVPEPGSLGLLAGGAGCLAAWRLRKAKRKPAADGAGTALVS